MAKVTRGALVCALSLALGLSGCPQAAPPSAPADDTPATDTPVTSKAFAVNSAWQVAFSADVEKARTLKESEFQAQVDAYNAANTDDQERVYFDEVPAIGDAPAASLYMVVQGSHVIAEEALGVPRADLVVQGGKMGEPFILYIDHAPPTPAPPGVQS